MHAALLLLVAGVWVTRAEPGVEQRAAEFLKRFDENATKLMYQYSLASWAYNTNITSENGDKLVSAPYIKTLTSLLDMLDAH